MATLRVSVLVGFCLAVAARADVMTFSVTGGLTDNPAIVNEPSIVTPNIPQTVIQFVTGAWSQTIGLSGVSVDVWLNGSGIFDAYLTGQIGPGTTIANQIAASVFTANDIPGPIGNDFTIFTGLTLPAGTYYLTIAQSSPDTGSLAGWPGTANPVVTGTPTFQALQGMFGGSLLGGIDDAYLPGSVVGGDWASNASTGFNPEPTYRLMGLSGALCADIWCGAPPQPPLASVPELTSGSDLGIVILVLVLLHRRGLAN